MQEDHSILHGYGEVEGSTKISPAVFVGSSVEISSKTTHAATQDLTVRGYAAWVSNQLSREVSLLNCGWMQVI